MTTIDARGLSCPQPVIMLKAALDAKPDCCELVVDNHTSRENTTRFAESVGYNVTCVEANGEFRLTFRRK